MACTLTTTLSPLTREYGALTSTFNGIVHSVLDIMLGSAPSQLVESSLNVYPSPCKIITVYCSMFAPLLFGVDQLITIFSPSFEVVGCYTISGAKANMI